MGALLEWLEVGSLLGMGVMIGIVSSGIGGAFFDALGVAGTLLIFFAAGWLFLTRKVRELGSRSQSCTCFRRVALLGIFSGLNREEDFRLVLGGGSLERVHP